MVSWADRSRIGDRNGFLSSPSSSEVSTGVRAGVSKGCGRVRGDCEKVLMYFIVGEVRKGRVRGFL